jgi:hypothetical protein
MTNCSDDQSRASGRDARLSLIPDGVTAWVLKPFQCRLSKESKMRKLIISTILFVLLGISASYARGGMHSSGAHGLMAPANPTVPPSLTSDRRLTGAAPLPPHHQPTSADVSSLPDAMLKPDREEVAVDRAIGNICRGC